MRTLFKFHGGVHPPGNKTQSTQQPTAAAPIPAKLVIPFRQHAGEAAKPVVQVGDHVLKGQLIGEPAGFISSAIHAPTSGTIAAIDMQPVAHPSGMPDLCATLIPDGRDEWVERKPADYRTLPADELRHLLRMAGIVGLGGAVFPSDIKLRPLRDHPNKDIGTLILNGAECEPWITCDDMLMRERAAEIVQGAEMLRSMLGSREVLIGIEDNKPEAIAAMRLAVADSGLPFEVVAVPTIYPGGSAKQLIRVLTGQEVPSGKLPTDIGVQCFNVATVYSAWRAVAHGEPLISRIVTVTGNVARPRNYEALIGTPLTDLIALGEPLPDTDGYIMGGPMMGMPLPSISVPLVKASNCLIAGSKKLFPPPPPTLPCIRCTRCAQACPADLQPMDLYWFSQSKNFGQAQAFSLFDCIECGACSYVCPSHIPLVQYFRFSKSEIRMREQEKQAADRARERHEYREFRIEREKQEKAERLAAKEKAAAAAKPVEPPVVATNPDAAPENTAQMKIQAAIEHAKEQAAAIKPKNTENLPPELLAEIAEIEARRARIRETAKSDVEPPNGHDKK
ncbi:MAG: electron transport complex subunit RsxC [Gallionella sp.]